MEQIQEVLGLPVQVLSVLAAGYLSYRVAFTGKDASHRTVDVIFLVSVFAFIAQAAVLLVWFPLTETFGNLHWAGIWSGLLGIAAALVAASFWRKWGERWTFHALRASGVTHADRHNTAWETVISKSRINGSVLVIRKKDGSEVMSEDLSRFNGLPFGSCVLGRDGSVALYVTHRRALDADDWSERDPSPHEDWGAPVTVIPASEIAEIEFRAA